MTVSDKIIPFYIFEKNSSGVSGPCVRGRGV